MVVLVPLFNSGLVAILCRMARSSTLVLQALVALLCLTVVSGQFFVNLNDKNKVLQTICQKCEFASS